MERARYADRVALITGAASGIGRATAQRWAADGGKVVAGDLSDEGLASLADELGNSCVTTRCDVTSEADVAALAALAIETYGRLDAAMAGPGMGGAEAIVNMSVDHWRTVLDVTLTGVMLTVKHAGRVMTDGGSIVAIASVNGRQPGFGLSAYNCAKAGVIMLCQIAAMELGHRDINVNSVCPGLIATPMSEPMFDGPLKADWEENTPLTRNGSPEEVAALMCWLASEEAHFITGEAIAIDGGIHLRRYPDMTRVGLPLDPL